LQYTVCWRLSILSIFIRRLGLNDLRAGVDAGVSPLTGYRRPNGSGGGLQKQDCRHPQYGLDVR